MPQIPTHIDDFDVEGFTAWLREQGAIILDPTNEWEVMRYKLRATPESRTPVIHSVYKRKRGDLTYRGNYGVWASKHYATFLRGDTFLISKVKPKPKPPARMDPIKRNRVVKSLLKRDGDECWFCGGPLKNDITIEHLVPRSVGGGNDLKNLVLAHSECNQLAADMDMNRKIEFKAALSDLPPWKPTRVALEMIL